MQEIFNKWPSLAELARDIGESPIAVRHWKRRGSIPGEYDVAIVNAASKRGQIVTYEMLALARAKEARALIS